jgi:hypothetical protein
MMVFVLCVVAVIVRWFVRLPQNIRSASQDVNQVIFYALERERERDEMKREHRQLLFALFSSPLLSSLFYWQLHELMIQ